MTSVLLVAVKYEFVDKHTYRMINMWVLFLMWSSTRASSAA